MSMVITHKKMPPNYVESPANRILLDFDYGDTIEATNGEELYRGILFMHYWDEIFLYCSHKLFKEGLFMRINTVGDAKNKIFVASTRIVLVEKYTMNKTYPKDSEGDIILNGNRSEMDEARNKYRK